ncbi:hypothetical protein HK097_001849, partial [Rhizophlyctis rosea]
MHVPLLLTTLLLPLLTTSQKALVYPGPSFKSASATQIASCDRVRTILWDGKQLLALCPGRSTLGQIMAIWEDQPGSGNWQNQTILTQALIGVPGQGEKAPEGWNHGFAFSEGYIYMSTPSAVTRWKHTPGDRTIMSPNDGQVVVRNISAPRDASGALLGSTTRTLTFHNTNTNHLFVSIGNVADTEHNPYHGLVRWFDVSAVPEGGFEFYSQGNIWSDGVRNAVGMAFDASGNLWAADMASDIQNRTVDSMTLAQSHEDSPLDEINLLKKDEFYGWPWCFTAGGTGPSAGKQLAWNPTNDPFGDAWCGNATNNEPPMATVPAHVSPLSMTFLADASGCGTDSHSFPCEMKGDMFLALHGSVTNEVPKGYSVIRVPFKNSLPQQSSIETIFEVSDLVNQCKDEGTPKAFTKCVRPVGLTFDNRGRLFVGSDSTNEIYMVHFGGGGSSSNAGAAGVGK